MRLAPLYRLSDDQGMKISRRDWMLAAGAGTLATQGCVSSQAEVEEGHALPKFHARTLKGETFDNANVSGKVVLLQFWATWCGYCRREQPAVDKVTKEFENQGLVVLAVNVGEPRDKVVEYLRDKPRACHIVMSDDTNLARIFRAEGFPKYVVINRQGKVAGNQDGAGGIMALRDLLSGAGLKSSS
jgi:thiol-disulfide isomerase/thioredoxin